MTGLAFTESIVEQAAVAWLERLGWMVKHDQKIAPDMGPIQGGKNIVRVWV